MRKLSFFIPLIIFLFIGQALLAQSTGSSYRTALGAKVYFGDGTTGGINIKHFLNAHGAIEGSLLFEKGHLGFEGMYDWHGDIQGAAGLKWYVGGGGLLFFPTDDDYGDDVLFALKGALGLDYKFNGAPINISFDLNPVFILTPDTDFDFVAGLAFRFTL